MGCNGQRGTLARRFSSQAVTQGRSFPIGSIDKYHRSLFQKRQRDGGSSRLTQAEEYYKRLAQKSTMFMSICGLDGQVHEKRIQVTLF